MCQTQFLPNATQLLQLDRYNQFGNKCGSICQSLVPLSFKCFVTPFYKCVSFSNGCLHNLLGVQK